MRVRESMCVMCVCGVCACVCIMSISMTLYKYAVASLYLRDMNLRKDSDQKSCL